MEAFHSILINVLIAVIVTVIVLGPLAALIWYSLRTVAAAAMVYVAVALVIILVLVAGQTAWTPGSSPLPYLGLALILAAALGYGAWRVADGALVVTSVMGLLSILALAWVMLGWKVLVFSWTNLGNTSTVDFMQARRDAPPQEASAQRSADARAMIVMSDDSSRMAQGRLDPDAPHPARDGFLDVEDASGAPHRLTFRDDLDVAYVGPLSLPPNRKFLDLIADDRMDRYRAGRELVLLTTSSGNEELERTRGVRVLRIPLGARLEYGISPGFFDPASRMFRHGTYRWMKDVLGIPKEERDAIYSEYVGKVPE